MFSLNDLLQKIEVSPKDLLVMRHRPTEASLRKVLPWFAVERPELFNAYQSAQGNENTEIALSRAKFLASFIGIEPGKAHFVGLYRQEGSQKITSAEYYAIPENAELHKQGNEQSSVAVIVSSIRPIFGQETFRSPRTFDYCLEWPRAIMV